MTASDSLPLATLSFIGTVVVGRQLILRKHANREPLSTLEGQHHSSLPTPAQALKLVETRRSIFTKQFTGKAVHRSVVHDMLEAARWAPNHHITEPWRFIVFESQESREKVGVLLGELYQSAQLKKGKPVSQAKFDKKLTGAKLASHIIAICVRTDTKNPFVEEVSSVAMAVQNMHLMATCHGVGAYWSSGGVHAPGSSSTGPVDNPEELSRFLAESDTSKENLDGSTVCLGWLYIGDYFGDLNGGLRKKWPSGRRSPIEDKTTWR